MCDNFETIRNFLNFENPNTLYYINVFQRKKDNPDLSKNSVLLKCYYIRSLTDFNNYKVSIIKACELNKARAYIELNAKDTQKIALYALKKTAELIYNGEYDAVKNVYNDSCGNSKCIGQKLWLIDIDSNDSFTEEGLNSTLNLQVESVKQQLFSLDSEIKLTLNTKNGIHLICTPFPLNNWKKIENVDIIKHAVTLLYMFSS